MRKRLRRAVRSGPGSDRHAGGDGAGGKDVGSQAAVADESFEGVGFGEALQVCAGLTEMLAEVLDVANEEPASDKVVQIDTSGDDVAAGVGVGQAVSVGEPILLGVLGFAVVVFGGFDAYRGRMEEPPAGSGLFSIPEHQGSTFGGHNRRSPDIARFSAFHWQDDDRGRH